MLIAAFVLYRFTTGGSKREAPGNQPAAAPVKPVTPPADTTAGSKLNHTFPAASGAYKITFTQEKEGFAQADLTEGSTKLATITVSDTETNPSARDKFAKSEKKVAGYPLAAVGNQGTALLVANRFQVQVRSVAPAFSETQRIAWIEKCDLAALAAMARK